MIRQKRTAAGVISLTAVVVLITAFVTLMYFGKSRTGLPSDNAYPNVVSDVPAPVSTEDESAVSSESETDITVSSQTEEVSGNETQPTEETVRKSFISTNTSSVIHSDANLNSKNIANLDKGKEAEVLSEKGSFYKIRYSRYGVGWIHKNCCDPFEKDVTVRHIPARVTGEAYGMSGTKEGNDLEDILHSYGAIGASVAVIKNGRVSYHLEYGYADRETKVKVAENTKFRIASISKVFTAMLAMTEVDDGKLDLDADLSGMFGKPFCHPKFPDNRVTERMLLTHTAGITSKEGLYSEPLRDVVNNADYYTTQPGKRFLYSNLGLGIAGAVVEKVADTTISKYSRDRFFAPMGIDASFDGQYLADKSLVANCYSKGKVSRSNAELTRAQEKKDTKPGDIYHLGQGGLIISAVDLAKVSTVLLNRGQFEGKTYLTEKTVNEMLTPHSVTIKDGFEQCIGIRRSDKLTKSRTLYYHNGNFYGILALMAIDTSDGSGVIVITSGARSDRKESTVFEVCSDVLDYCYIEII